MQFTIYLGEFIDRIPFMPITADPLPVVVLTLLLLGYGT